MFKRNLFFIAFLFVSVSSLLAAPMVPCAVEKIQPDGTKITVYLKGDEKVNWMESGDGYTLMYDAQQYVVYAQQDAQGNLMPSTIKFGSGVPSANIVKSLRYSQAQINTLKQIWRMTEGSTVQRAATGTVKVLCVLASFSNKALVKTNSEFENLMNQVGYSVGGANGSVKDFYLEDSYGNLNIQVTVIGPVTVSQSVYYYSKSADPTEQRYRTFANEVVDLADPLVDYSQFATNGQVESFHIIFAGYGNEAIGDYQQIHAHQWTLPNIVTKDGVQLYNYSCSPELRGNSGSSITNIGVICHELGHILGSPDYYDVDYSGYTGSGKWDLMAEGSWNGGSTLIDAGRQPAHINPYQKIQFGWIMSQNLTAGSSVNNMPSSANNPIVYKIVANSNGEHYLLENRQYVGFDASLPGHGLLIWHISANVANYAPNNTHPQQVYPICACSTTPIPTSSINSYGTDLMINSAGCPFPGTSGKTTFSDSSIPQAFTWTGRTGIGKPVTNIIENGDQTVSFGYMISPPVISGPTLLCRSAENFTVTGAPAGFTWNVSPNLSIYSTSNNSASIGASDENYTSGSPGWISIKSNGVELTKKDVWIGYPEVQIDGPDNASLQARFYAIYDPLSNPSFYWSASGSYSLNNYGDYADIFFYNTALYTITLDACNVCGCGAGATKNVQAYTSNKSPSNFLVYPNPVSDILNIEINQQAIDNVKAQQQTSRNSSVNSEPIFEFRLYNEFGTQIRYMTAKSGIIQITVSDLPNGSYYLHIYDGVNSTPEKQIIVVQH